MLAVAIGTPPQRGTVRGRSTPPGLDVPSAGAPVKRRGVAFSDGDPKIREVYEYLFDYVSKVEQQTELRIEEVNLNCARRIDEIATSCAKRTEVVDRFSEIQQSLDHLRGGAQADLENRLAQGEKNITDALAKQQERLDSLAKAEEIIKKVTEGNFVVMYEAVQGEVNILKDTCRALSIEIEQGRLDANLKHEEANLNVNQVVQQMSLEIAQVRNSQSTRATGEPGNTAPSAWRATVDSGPSGARVGVKAL